MSMPISSVFSKRSSFLPFYVIAFQNYREFLKKNRKRAITRQKQFFKNTNIKTMCNYDDFKIIVFKFCVKAVRRNYVKMILLQNVRIMKYKKLSDAIMNNVNRYIGKIKYYHVFLD